MAQRLKLFRAERPVKVRVFADVRAGARDLACWNATQAAVRAGYSAKGARVRGVEPVTNRNVRPIKKADRITMLARQAPRT